MTAEHTEVIPNDTSEVFQVINHLLFNTPLFALKKNFLCKIHPHIVQIANLSILFSWASKYSSLHLYKMICIVRYHGCYHMAAKCI